MLYRSADVDVYSNMQPISQVLTINYMDASKQVIEEGMNRYVIPLELNIKTLCLFFLTPFGGPSSFDLLVFDNDL